MSRTKALSHFLCALFTVICASTLSATTYNCSAQFTVPGGPANIAGYNNSGTMSGIYRVGGTEHGFIEDAAGNFSTIDPAGSVETLLYQINNNGVAVGRYYPANSSISYPFTATQTGAITMVNLPAPYTLENIYGINDNDAISARLRWDDSSGGHLSFAILNPDGTVTLVPGDSGLSGSLNNSGQMLESGTEFGGNSLSELATGSGALTQIQYPYPAPVVQNLTTFGLNNAGVLVGYMFFNSGQGFQGRVGYMRDASGVYSEAMCPGISADQALPIAINDNGVILAGTDRAQSTPAVLMTPIPGTAQVSLSATSLTFPPQPDGTTSAPQTVTLTNTGNARLDIAEIAVAVENMQFNVTSCAANNTFVTSNVVSLNPGDTCTINVTVTASSQAGGNGIIVIDDSAPGAPHTIALAVAGQTAPPSCTLSGVSGSPLTATFTAQDAFSGLATIQLLSSSNATVNIPTFNHGTESPVNITATQSNSSQASSVNFRVTNTAGLSTDCGTTFGGAGGQWISLGGSIQGKVSMVTNADGRLEAFARGTDNSVKYISQSAPDGTWGNWESLGGVIISDPTATTNSQGVVEVFAVGTDGGIWMNSETSAGVDTWTGWTSLGFSATSDISATLDRDGNLIIFARGGDFGLWYEYQLAGSSGPGTFSAPVSLGGYVTADPSAGAAGILQAFVRGGDGAIWTTYQSAPGLGFNPYFSLGGNIANDIALSEAQGVFTAFVRGTDNSVLYNRQNSAGTQSWTGWIGLGGYVISDPAVLAYGGENIVFATGGDNAVWTISQTPNGWGPWMSLGGTPANVVTPAANTDGRVAIFAQGPGNALYYREQVSAGSWN